MNGQQPSLPSWITGPLPGTTDKPASEKTKAP